VKMVYGPTLASSPDDSSLMMRQPCAIVTARCVDRFRAIRCVVAGDSATSGRVASRSDCGVIISGMIAGLAVWNNDSDGAGRRIGWTAAEGARDSDDRRGGGSRGRDSPSVSEPSNATGVQCSEVEVQRGVPRVERVGGGSASELISVPCECSVSAETIAKRFHWLSPTGVEERPSDAATSPSGDVKWWGITAGGSVAVIPRNGFGYGSGW
jgi:hypothetical protein